MTYILDRWCEDPISYAVKSEAYKAAVRYTYDTGHRARVYQDGLILMSSDVSNGQLVMCSFGYSPVKAAVADLPETSDGCPSILALLE